MKNTKNKKYSVIFMAIGTLAPIMNIHTMQVNFQPQITPNTHIEPANDEITPAHEQKNAPLAPFALYVKQPLISHEQSIHKAPFEGMKWKDYGLSPLFYSLLISNAELMKLFLNKGANINIVIHNGIEILTQLSIKSSSQLSRNIFKMLKTSFGIDTSKKKLHNDMSLLDLTVYSTVYSLNLDVVELLLTRNVNVNGANTDGLTLLMQLAKAENVLCDKNVYSRYLFHHGTIKTQVALLKTKIQAMIRALIIAGAPLDTIDRHGKTVFNYASKTIRQCIRNEQPTLAHLGLFEYVWLDSNNTLATKLPHKKPLTLITDYLIPYYDDSESKDIGLNNIIKAQVVRIKTLAQAEKTVALALPTQNSEKIMWSYLPNERAEMLAARKTRMTAATIGANLCTVINSLYTPHPSA